MAQVILPTEEPTETQTETTHHGQFQSLSTQTFNKSLEPGELRKRAILSRFFRRK
jgi:hypothetical protein